MRLRDAMRHVSKATSRNETVGAVVTCDVFTYFNTTVHVALLSNKGLFQRGPSVARQVGMLGGEDPRPQGEGDDLKSSRRSD